MINPKSSDLQIPNSQIIWFVFSCIFFDSIYSLWNMYLFSRSSSFLNPGDIYHHLSKMWNVTWNVNIILMNNHWHIVRMSYMKMIYMDPLSISILRPFSFFLLLWKLLFFCLFLSFFSSIYFLVLISFLFLCSIISLLLSVCSIITLYHLIWDLRLGICNLGILCIRWFALLWWFFIIPFLKKKKKIGLV